ncbi:hypothetical protein Calab_1409 [Caldithrix abyssi DSM 13497]|uniref:DUF4160 domain-containing protein n=1 Tax=Caldithrix abyssi DSM 13497 TaxID=880073 RepID=H1XP38_CALAY|nr:DUF4160 domain-containing protein [Caldithrix abyssi]EHO41030.1 hypothetical protein Calab_1409 [Caldithrix abyssi DSM 13497]
MPTILRDGPYRFFFYSSDGNEPVHVHVERENKITKIWLDPVRVCNNFGFNRSELYKILKLVEQHEEKIKEAWHEFFDH